MGSGGRTWVLMFARQVFLPTELPPPPSPRVCFLKYYLEGNGVSLKSKVLWKAEADVSLWFQGQCICTYISEVSSYPLLWGDLLVNADDNHYPRDQMRKVLWQGSLRSFWGQSYLLLGKAWALGILATSSSIHHHPAKLVTVDAHTVVLILLTPTSPYTLPHQVWQGHDRLHGPWQYHFLSCQIPEGLQHNPHRFLALILCYSPQHEQ